MYYFILQAVFLVFVLTSSKGSIKTKLNKRHMMPATEPTSTIPLLCKEVNSPANAKCKRAKETTQFNDHAWD